MRNTDFIFVALVILVGVLVQESVQESVQASEVCNDRYCPFYFGQADLFCVKKNGLNNRSYYPTRHTLQLTHRYLYYRGKYIEFGSNGWFNVGTKRWGPTCRHRTEDRPAGWSAVSVDCVRKCAHAYRWHYGRYNWLFNNCHNFANRMARILTDGKDCPSWCK